MTIPLRAVALLSALLAAACSASAHGAEKIHWPVPWAAGDLAAFDTESVVREIEDGKQNARRITDRTEIRTDEAGGNGYVLTWVTRDSRIEAVEGDRSMVDVLAPMLDEFDGMQVVIELDRNGQYRRVRNLEPLITKVRATMLPILSANLDSMFRDADPKLSKADLDLALTMARSNLGASIDSIITPQGVEAMSSAQAKTMTAFVGKTLEVGKRYRDNTPLESPTEGRPLPAAREYTLSLVEGDPGLARIRWTRTLDTEGDPEALWMLVGELIGSDELMVARRGRPKDLSLVEQGVVLFRRDTGAIEMLETVEITRYGSAHDEHQRDRMRRSGSTRTWAQEEAAAR